MRNGPIDFVVSLTCAAFCLMVGAVMGMEFDPNGEYCASRTHLLPAAVDCRYEQSTGAPGDEVCK